MDRPVSRFADRPYSLENAQVATERQQLLRMQHIAPLTDFVEGLRTEFSDGVPYFDPLDAGVGAEALFLLATPGPKAVGTNYVSRNNPDPTAKNMFNLLLASGIARDRTLLWNIVPWNVSTTEKNADVSVELVRRGTILLLRLLSLLPRLRCIVLCGNQARRAAADLAGLVDCIFETYHPAARSYNFERNRVHIRQSFESVLAFVNGEKYSHAISGGESQNCTKRPEESVVRRTNADSASSSSYSEAWHLDKTDQARKTLYNDLRHRILELYPSARIKPVKLLVGFRSAMNFAEVHIQRDKLRIHIRPRDYVDPRGLVNVRPNAGYTMNRHFYLGEYDDLDYAISLISQSLADTIH